MLTKMCVSVYLYDYNDPKYLKQMMMMLMIMMMMMMIMIMMTITTTTVMMEDRTSS
jgi:hypothetical protein